SRNVELSEKISEAAVLEAERVHITTFYSRFNNEQEVEDQTSRASRVNKLRIEFSFHPNQVAEEGERKVYFRILDPEGNLLEPAMDVSREFTELYGDKVRCTAHTTIFYSRSSPVYAVVLRLQTSLAKGNYRVQLFTDGRAIGEGKFSLR